MRYAPRSRITAVEESDAVLVSARVAWSVSEAVGVSANAPASARDTTRVADAVGASFRTIASDTSVTAVMDANASSAMFAISAPCAKKVVTAVARSVIEASSLSVVVVWNDTDTSSARAPVSATLADMDWAVVFASAKV